MFDYTDYITPWDFILLPIYLLVIYVVARRVQKNNIKKDSIYKYFVVGLFVKILGGLCFNFVYLFYYQGGDAVAYYQGGKAFVNLLLQDTHSFFSIFLGNTTPENWSCFDTSTGWPPYYMYKDAYALNVCRFIVPFMIFSFNRFLITTVLIDVFAYIGIWQFYKMLSHQYPYAKKTLSIAVLFIPSVFFWGSGIMKDTFTLSAVLWAFANIYTIFYKKKNIVFNAILFIINMLLIALLKPYLIIALLPTLGIWTLLALAQYQSNKILRFITSPILFISGIFLGIILLSLISKNLSKYSSTESILTKAQITQQDHIRSEQYGENYYDIGYFDASVSGILAKTPSAIMAGLFRPFIWESQSPVVFVFGLENLLFLLGFFFVLIKVGPLRFIDYLRKDSILLSFLIFIIIVSFAVGLTSANFGALARLKIPLIPFLAALLIILFIKKKNAALIK